MKTISAIHNSFLQKQNNVLIFLSDNIIIESLKLTAFGDDFKPTPRN